MSQPRTIRAAALRVSVLAALLAMPALAAAKEYAFKVSYEDIPGVDELEAGDVDEGIAILESQLSDRKSRNYGHALATLCGAYVMTGEYDKAASVCDKAVRDGPADTAYNNRGVLRVHTGDLTGASQDFDRARPERVEEYVELLYGIDPKLIASSNYETLNRYNERKMARSERLAKSIGGASIEDVLD